MSGPRVLVVRDSALGDLLTAVPALRALRRVYPNHRLVTTCPTALRSLAEWLDVADSLDGPSDEKCDLVDPARHPDADEKILAGLRAPNLGDIVVLLRVPEHPDVVRRLLSGRPAVFISFRLDEVRETWGGPQFTFDEHILRRWRRLLGAYEIEVYDGDVFLDEHARTRSRLGSPLPDAPSGRTVVHVGSASRSREWPLARWVEVVRELVVQGHKVVLTGSPSEHPAAAEVRRRTGLSDEHDLSGRTDVLTLAALVASARLVLSTDTGPAHLAAAFRRPAVTLYGPVPPAWWGPPTEVYHHVCLWHGSYGEPYADEADPGLLAIGVEDVLSAVPRALSVPPTEPLGR